MLSGRISSQMDETGAVSLFIVILAILSIPVLCQLILIFMDNWLTQIFITWYIVCTFQIFIDRDPVIFSVILNFMRTKEVDFG